jgi:hypothetical protein
MNAALRASDCVDVWSTQLGVNSVRITKGQIGRRLQPQALNNSPAQFTDARHLQSSLQEITPSSRPQHGVEHDVPQLEQNPQVFREKIRSAMQRRVGPGTGLTVKMVARATMLTERTIENAMAGNNTPRGDTLMTLVDFFDASFANEIFAGSTFLVVKLSDQRAADAARMINDGIAILAGRGK